MFSYFHNEKRPNNMGRFKRWEDKILKDIEDLQIYNWRRLTHDRTKWRELINKNVFTKPVASNIKDIVYEYKQKAAQRRRIGFAAFNGSVKYKVTEVLVKQNNRFTCPGCKFNYKPQGITNHVRSCVDAKAWCIQNKII
jgi:hypothetical protein